MISTRLELLKNSLENNSYMHLPLLEVIHIITLTYKLKNRRFLSKFVFVKWAIIDNADIGTIEAQSPQSNFE